jgi:hypothetical protein
VYGNGPTGVYGTGNYSGVSGDGATYGLTGNSGGIGVYGTGGATGVAGSGTPRWSPRCGRFRLYLHENRSRSRLCRRRVFS